MKISAQLTPEAMKTLRRFQALTGAALPAIAAGMDTANQKVWENLTMKRLTGKGPFPVAEHRLGMVTGDLRKTMRTAAAQIVGNTVVSSIGTNLVYAGVHEFGFTGDVTVKDHFRNVIQKRFEGRLISENEATRLGLRTKSGKLRAKVKVSVKKAIVLEHTRHMDIPARAPIRTSIEENASVYSKEISKEIIKKLGSYD